MPPMAQFRQQAAWTAVEPGFLFGAPVQQSDEQISHHADESVNVQLLIGPVKLWPGGKHAGIFQIAKCGLHLRLSAIGFDNLRRGPLGTVGNQNGQMGFGTDCYEPTAPRPRFWLLDELRRQCTA